MPLENNMSTSASFCCILMLLSTLLSASDGRDTITQSESIKDGETLVSAGGIYVLGFFITPGDSKNRYVGIWFAVSPEAIVWVANRDRPLSDSTGILGLDTTGNLVLTDRTNQPIWSSLLPEAGSTVAQLLDSGNLVVRDVSSGNTDVFLWQSFDYPSDTMLAGMKLGPDYRAGWDRALTSWRNASDPSPGEFTFRLDPRGLGQLFLWGHQPQPVYRSGPWNGLRFSGTPEMASYDMFNFTVVEDQEESYYQFGITKPGTLARLVANQSGLVQRLVWIEGTATWDDYWYGPKDPCDNYACCGPYGLCNVTTSPVCACLPGFHSKNTSDWNQRNWKGGCVRKTKLNCSDGDGFLLVPQVKLPDTVNSTVNVGMSLGQCREVCLKNCSCTAYARANISVGGSGCVIWFGDLVDIRQFTSDGQDLYLRLAASELDSMTSDSHKKKKVAIIVTLCTVLVGLLLLVACGCFIWYKNRVKLLAIEEGTNKQYVIKCHGGEDHELLVFDFATIAAATNIFSDKNMIGKGGFGIVSMGKLDVAVKRLSLHSGQGVDEFKTEVTLIAKLQHRNLVRLLGYCVEGEERMLIYEYMPNKSLDDFLFDPCFCGGEFVPECQSVHWTKSDCI
uniref:Receptor-like serine/threonine-protein kinase SD1-8 n=1 Tax=Anthurium amnicola TaxID=1678845 RepID=A0A1D1Z1M7_9ARAE